MVKTIEKRLARAEVPVEMTWNLEDLYPSKEAWEAELTEIEKLAEDCAQFKGRVQEGADVLLACLLHKESVDMKLVTAGTYVSLKESADGSDPDNQADSARFAALYARIAAATSFIQSEILALPEGKIDQYIIDEPKLEVFRKTLNDIKEKKKHRLSAETEEALAALGETLDAPYKIYGISKNADMDFASIEDKNGNELAVSAALYEDRYEFAADTDVRRKAYKSFTDTLARYQNTFAAVYASEVAAQKAIAGLRKYSSITEMLLQQQKVSREMYDTQIDTVFQELAPHMRRYAKLKERVLGLGRIHYADLKAPLDQDFNPATTYEEAGRIILEALSVMGTEYTDAVKMGLENRWVDRADNIGKRTGAFCSSPYGTHPYILITWQDTMRGAFVLAHELGHAGHFYFANKEQRLYNTRPSMYMIEAPSTLNEMLLGRHLLKQTDDKQMRRWVILQMIGTYYHNFVTHLLEGEFQRRVYALAEKGAALTAKTLNGLFSEVLQEFWGDAVELDEAAALTWMRQPHYYMGLYPYTYSAGLTASTAMAQKIEDEGQPAVERWLEMLKAGGTMEPLELLKHAGVDMENPETIKSAVAYVGSLIDELEQLYA